MKIRKGNQIEAIVFRKTNKDNYEFLLLKRIPERGGFWQPITGGIEEGETSKEAIKRELKEEINIKKVLRIIENVHYFILKEVEKEEFVFGVEISLNGKVNLDKNIYKEHDKYIWCSLDEALKLLKWPENKEGLKKLYKILISK